MSSSPVPSTFSERVATKVPSAALLRAKKSQKKGLKFTIMLCGPSGCGKSTFINTLCGREVVSLLDKQPEHVFDPSNAHRDPGLAIVPITEDIPDDRHGVLSLKFIDTPGFGDNIDNTACFKQLSEYIEQQFDQVLAEESRIRRNPKFTDNRVHALIYFVVPTGHGLRETDVEFMKLMASKVNVIPVIAKADSLTFDELALNKRLIIEDIDHYNIPVYSFPLDSESDISDSDEESGAASSDSSLRSLLPFAVVGGTQLMKLQGKSTLVRQYPWGVVDITDPKVSDISVLCEVLLQTHLADLKDTTHDYLYENYRTEKLSRDPQDDGDEVDDLPPQQPTRSALSGPPMPNSASLPQLHVQKGGAAPGGQRSASAAYVIREEKLRQEEDKLKSIELRVQEEIARKREELLRREEELRQLEVRLQMEAKQLSMAS